MSRASCFFTAARSASVSCAASPHSASFLQALPRFCRCSRLSGFRPPRLFGFLAFVWPSPPERGSARSSGQQGVLHLLAARIVPRLLTRGASPLGPTRGSWSSPGCGAAREPQASSATMHAHPPPFAEKEGGEGRSFSRATKGYRISGLRPISLFIS